jgi:hypothetical protein
MYLETVCPFESKEGLGKVCTASFGAQHDVVPKLFSVPYYSPSPPQQIFGCHHHFTVRFGSTNYRMVVVKELFHI